MFLGSSSSVPVLTRLTYVEWAAINLYLPVLQVNVLKQMGHQSQGASVCDPQQHIGLIAFTFLTYLLTLILSSFEIEIIEGKQVPLGLRKVISWQL